MAELNWIALALLAFILGHLEARGVALETCIPHSLGVFELFLLTAPHLGHPPMLTVEISAVLFALNWE